MEKQLDLIISEFDEGNMTLDTLKSKLMLLFSASNSALIEACKIVVDGYEGDGMENMHNRDDVFYEYCKRALEHS